MGNGGAKELRYKTHGYELRGDCQREWGIQGGRKKGGNWDNCSSIINNIYFLKKKDV